MLEKEDFGLSKNPNRIRIWNLRLAFDSAKIIYFLNLSPFTQTKGFLINIK